MTEVDDFRTLSGWLSHGGFEVFWNKKNNEGYPVFSVKGLTEKPDLFLRLKSNPFWYNTAVEVKPPRDFDIRKGCKILDYWKNYINNQTTYFADELTIFPKYFVVATECSKEGKLFESDKNLEPIHNGGHREKAIEMGIIPKSEYTHTFDFVRHLWATWRDVYNRNDKKQGAIGVLLSSVLDNNSNSPCFMYEDYDRIKNRWRQRWRKFE